MAADLTAELARIERRLRDDLDAAATICERIGDALQDPSGTGSADLARAAGRLRRSGTAAQAEMVTAMPRDAPAEGDLHVALAIIELAHHGVLIANQFDLIAEHLAQIDPGALDRQRTGTQLALMSELAGAQLRRALQAFAGRDRIAAEEIQRRDDALDHINRHVFGATLELDATRDQRELALRYVLIARSLERIGDNAVDIAEQTVFLVTAQLHEFTDASRPKPAPRAPGSSRLRRLG